MTFLYLFIKLFIYLRNIHLKNTGLNFKKTRKTILKLFTLLPNAINYTNHAINYTNKSRCLEQQITLLKRPLKKVKCILKSELEKTLIILNYSFHLKIFTLTSIFLWTLQNLWPPKGQRPQRDSRYQLLKPK